MLQMEITQIGMNQANEHFVLTKGKVGVTDIEMLDDKAVVSFGDETEFVIMKDYITCYVKGKPIVHTGDFEEPKKSKRHKKVVRRK